MVAAVAINYFSFFVVISQRRCAASFSVASNVGVGPRTERRVEGRQKRGQCFFGKPYLATVASQLTVCVRIRLVGVGQNYHSASCVLCYMPKRPANKIYCGFGNWVVFS